MSVRPEVDRCPGMLRPFAAEDGAIVRLRRPGGRLPVASLVTMMRSATRYGTPFVQLTSRANLQVRGLADPLPAEFVAAAGDAGFLPHPTHERVRNLIASPWSVHREELAEFVAELDEALCADPNLARLPGRWLMVADDGSGHLLGLPADIGYQRTGPDDGLLVLAGERARAVARTRAVAEIVRVAQCFVAIRERMDPAPWNLADLPVDSPIFTGFAPLQRGSSTTPRRAPRANPAPGAGEFGADLVVTVPLGLLSADQVHALAEVSDQVCLTPWRRLVIPLAAGSPGVAERLAEVGLVVAPHTGWDQLTACIGAPYCRRTGVQTLRLANELVGEVGDVRTHLSGCERRCGRPATQHVELVAPGGVQEAMADLRRSQRV